MTARLAQAADTIVARATPPGKGGVAVVRVSGAAVREIAAGICGQVPEPRVATFTHFCDRHGDAIDSGLAIYFPSPGSFTGEEVVELQGHGGAVVCEMLVERVIEPGRDTFTGLW